PGCSPRGLGGQVKGESRYDAPSERYAQSAPMKAKRSEARDMYSEESAAAEPSGQNAGAENPASAQSDDESVIIYEADCSVSVKNVKDAVRSIELLCGDFGAYVENVSTSGSYQSASVTVRVPVKAFDSFLGVLSRVGTVVSKEVSASNVSDQCRDLAIRLDSAKKVKERLEGLLKKETDITQRIAILREIDRINARIESDTARLAYLKGRADYSAVRLSLSARTSDSVKRYLPSPFGWIRSLSPDAQSLKDYPDAAFTAPEGYFSLEKEFKRGESRYLYALPGESAQFRAGIAKNYPRTSLEFWCKALDFDAQNRLYGALSSSKIEGADGLAFELRCWKTSGAGFYAVACAVRGDEILVVEGVFTGQTVYNENIAVFEKLLRSARWK
ncbi:MAG: DUF4349 domain-containing protein, partial [Spirochaetota bacterium]